MFPVLLLACGPDETEPVLGTRPTEPAGVDADGDGVVAEIAGGRDCDDADPGVYPGAEETCDGVDQDCDGEVDEGLLRSAWTDADGDGYGAEGSEQVGCEVEGARRGGDCDDADPDRNPGRDERCNGVDDDCIEGTLEIAERGGRGYSDLQLAVDEASDGDLIELCDGAHEVSQIRIDRAVTIASRSGDPASAALVGDDRESVLIVTGALTLRGVTVRGGRGTTVDGARRGGGILAYEEGSSLVIEDCVIESNRAEWGGGVYARDLELTRTVVRDNEGEVLSLGGGIYTLEGGVVSITDCRFAENTAFYGAGLRISGDATLIRTVVADNEALVSGGGVWSEGAITLEGVTVSGNDASNGGGWYAPSGTITADAATVIENNTASSSGGGAELLGMDDMVWQGGTFRGNSADFGGGLFVDRRGATLQGLPGFVLVRDVTVLGNRAMNSPFSSGGGVYLLDSPVAVVDSLIEGNEAVLGGGASVNETSTVDTALTRVVFRDNLGRAVGGAFDMYQGRAQVTDCTFEGNEAGDGGAIMVDATSRLTTTGTTWGDGAFENTPDDVWVGDPVYPDDGYTYDWDGVVNLSCQLVNPGCEQLP